MLRFAPRTYSAFDLFDTMDHFFWNDPFFKRSSAPAPVRMKTDVEKKDGLYVMSMDLPGFKKEEIRAELKDGYLTIRAEHSEEKQDEKTENGGYVMRERSTGSCSRSFYVGEQVTEDQIQAAYQDGILHLSFPDAEAQKKLEEPKQITIA